MVNLLAMVSTFIPKLPDKVKEFAISSILPDIEDTFLANKYMGKLLARFSNPNPSSISHKVLDSWLLQEYPFLEEFPFL